MTLSHLRVLWGNILTGAYRLNRHGSGTGVSASDAAYLVRAHRWLSRHYSYAELRSLPLDRLLQLYQGAKHDPFIPSCLQPSHQPDAADPCDPHTDTGAGILPWHLLRKTGNAAPRARVAPSTDAPRFTLASLEVSA